MGLVEFIVIAVIGRAWVTIDERFFRPKRVSEMIQHATAMAGTDRIVALVDGQEIGGEDDPDYDILFAATDHYLIHVRRRRGGGSYGRWEHDAIPWQDVRPLVATSGSTGYHGIYVRGRHASGDVEAFIAAAQPHLRDPSGLLDTTRRTCGNNELMSVVHGGRGKDPSSPCLIGCTAGGVVFAEKGTARLIPWAQEPTVEIATGPPSTVLIRYGRRRVELQTPILGDPRELANAAATGLAAWRSQCAAGDGERDGVRARAGSDLPH